jgi:predicted DNA-binding protein
MELSRKTTILLPPRLHEHLKRVARQRGVSIGHLIREACETQYRYVSKKDRLDAAEELTNLGLPVASPGQMARESMPDPDEIMP